MYVCVCVNSVNKTISCSFNAHICVTFDSHFIWRDCINGLPILVSDNITDIGTNGLALYGNGYGGIIGSQDVIGNEYNSFTVVIKYSLHTVIANDSSWRILIEKSSLTNEFIRDWMICIRTSDERVMVMHSESSTVNVSCSAVVSNLAAVNIENIIAFVYNNITRDVRLYFNDVVVLECLWTNATFNAFQSYITFGGDVHIRLWLQWFFFCFCLFRSFLFSDIEKSVLPM